MPNLRDKKYFSNKITERFIKAMDEIIGTRDGVKVTAQTFGEIVGMSGSNLTRLRVSEGEHTVTVEAIGRLCNYYNVSADWLVSGKGDIFNTSVGKKLNALTLLKQATRAVEAELSLLESSNKKINKLNK